jgi:hypothetical protein
MIKESTPEIGAPLRKDGGMEMRMVTSNIWIIHHNKDTEPHIHNFLTVLKMREGKLSAEIPH